MLVITNRRLADKPLIDKINEVDKLLLDGIVLREKDLPLCDIQDLLAKLKTSNQIVINHPNLRYGKAICLPIAEMPLDNDAYKIVSIHSVDEAVKAEKYGANCILAGNIFKTACKLGLDGRGLDFLKAVVDSVNIPVFAIGGICDNNIEDVMRTGAYGVACMSLAMQSSNIDAIKRIIEVERRYREQYLEPTRLII